jgi:hypothetical protein
MFIESSAMASTTSSGEPFCLSMFVVLVLHGYAVPVCKAVPILLRRSYSSNALNLCFPSGAQPPHYVLPPVALAPVS